MDLPVSRIAQSQIIAEADGTIRLYDPAYENNLLILSDDVKMGHYVVCVSYNVEKGCRISKLMSLTSRYDFETLSRRTILNNITTRLRQDGYTVHDLGLMHKRDGQSYVGQRPIAIWTDKLTSETCYRELLEAA